MLASNLNISWIENWTCHELTRTSRESIPFPHLYPRFAQEMPFHLDLRSLASHFREELASRKQRILFLPFSTGIWDYCIRGMQDRAFERLLVKLLPFF